MAEPNGVMMQYFHWYSPEDGSLWRELAGRAGELAAAGFTSLWLPPPYKGAGGGLDVGYGVYDLFDLGEFDQKGSVRTKYGTREEFLAAVRAAKGAGLRVYADAVFNHRMGGDAEEEVAAIPLDPDNRYQPLGEARPLKVWTGFHFPGRAGKYSSMTWHAHHFQAVDHDDGGGYRVYLFAGKQFDPNVDLEKGNFDFLMGCDVDMDHPEVVGELQYWGRWLVETADLDGFRFDAVKHVKAEFFRDFMDAVRAQTGRELFGVGEYWSYEVEALHHFIRVTEGRVALFDAPLHHNFHLAGRAGRDYDLRRIFDGTLVQHQPTHAVTLVDNHDSQPLQALESVVEAWFKPLAYALILLRREGYPCVFYADYYGASYRDAGRDGGEYEIHLPAHRGLLDSFLRARQRHAHGEQYDYFDHANCVGWTRGGDAEHPGGLAVLMSSGEAGTKRMQTGQPHTRYCDATGHLAEPVTTDAEGWAEFRCAAGSVSVWVPQGL